MRHARLAIGSATRARRRLSCRRLPRLPRGFTRPPIRRMLPAAPMLSIEPTLPMHKRLPWLPMLRILPALPIESTLPELNRLATLKKLAMLEMEPKLSMLLMLNLLLMLGATGGCVACAAWVGSAVPVTSRSAARSLVSDTLCIVTLHVPLSFKRAAKLSRRSGVPRGVCQSTQ